MTHTMHMVRELLAFRPEGRGTSIASALNYLGRVVHRRSIVFLISDFYDPGFYDELKVSSRKHEIVSLYLYDPAEKELPQAGLMTFEDAETGRSIMLDTSDRRVRASYNFV